MIEMQKVNCGLDQHTKNRKKAKLTTVYEYFDRLKVYMVK